MNLKHDKNLFIHSSTITAAIFICLASWFGLNRIEMGINSDLEKSLKVTLDTAHKSAISLFENEKSTVRLWANDAIVRELAKELLLTERTPEALNQTPTQDHIQNLMKPLLGTLGYKGFFIISPEGINLASSRKSNTGTINLLVKQEGFLEQVLSGKTLVSLPQQSDVALEDAEGNLVEDLATMFTATQIKDATGKAIAVLAFRINPTTTFSPIFERGRMGPSGETYAFNRKGVMISESRFNDQLYSFGLISNAKNTNMEIDIRDPGVNLAIRQQPSQKRHEMPLTVMASSAIKGEVGINLDGYRDYRGIPVIGAWLWDDELGFGITTEIDVEEAHFRHNEIRIVVLLFSFVCLLLLLFVFMVFTQNRKRIAQEKNYFSSIINNTAEGMITIDQQSIIETLNPAVESIFGYTSDELIGNNVSMLLPENERAQHKEYVKHSDIHAPRIINQARELYAVHKDGHKIPIELNISPMESDGERKFVGIMHDITEKKADEVELYEKQKLINLLHSVTTLANESLDIEESLQGSLEMICKYLNWPVGHIYLQSPTDPNKLVPSKIWYLDESEPFSEFVAITEQTEFKKGEEMPGRVLESKQIIWIEDAAAELDFIRAANTNIEIRSGICFPLIIEDDVFAVMEFYTPNKITNSPQELQATLTNIGIQLGRVIERANAEKNILDAKQEAEKANHAKSDFISSMSHELRTPLHAILGFSQILGFDDKKNPLTEIQKENLSHISKAGNHLLELINKVLELATIEAGKLSLNPTAVNTRQLVDECVSFTMMLAEKRNITLKDNTVDSTPIIWADPLRSKQALLNLLSNAVKYNCESGTIWLNAEQLNASMLRISVTDTGAGITKEKISEVFQPFNRLGADKSEVEGTGIGLSITKQLVENMGGAIGFKGNDGKGSTFWIDLPIAKEQPLQQSHQDTTVVDLNIITDKEQLLLYVEDNPSNLALMENIIQRIPNLSMISTHNAELGIALAEAKRPDVIIFDINLPGMSGIEAVKHLKMSDVTKDIPVLALSADIIPNTIKIGIESGFIDYLTKPVNLPKLITALQDALAKVA